MSMFLKKVKHLIAIHAGHIEHHVYGKPIIQVKISKTGQDYYLHIHEQAW